jgi:anti-anti-sigma factor
MKVKTDTKEKFHAISVETLNLSANMAADLGGQLIKLLHSSNRNVVLKLALVNSLDKEAAEVLVKLQQKFYESNASFVICGLTPQVEKFLDTESLLELMNVTPTESEAWDIIQMEEIERELLGDENEEYN